MSSSPDTTTILLLLCCLMVASQAVTFKCTSSTVTCQSLIGYVFANTTTYANITSLFQVSFSDLLGTNNLSLTTSKSDMVKAGSTVRIPIPCKCSEGIGQSDQIPVYTVVAGDGLDAIARYKFDQFVNDTEIATANNISDPTNIDIGQKVWIPLPCSCDEVEEEPVMHLAYQVAAGNTVDTIAVEFNTTESTLLKLNGIDDPKSIQADQILDVPLKVCQSSISSDSPDYGLLLSNDTYTLTANDCVICSCSSSSYVLVCMLVSDKSSSCHAMTCSDNATLSLGPLSDLSLGSTVISDCELSTCSYTGYSNTSSSINILTTLTDQSTACTSGSSSQTARSRSSCMSFAISLHMILIWICFMS
ncbi:hypothetical protein LUZ60_014524 [Juncus effusus]|nr:hypothetical protein LUZ60_014524 [Juncus effusus]